MPLFLLLRILLRLWLLLPTSRNATSRHLQQLFGHGHYIYANALEDVKLRALRDRKRHLDVGFYYCLPWFLILSFRFG
jgi:hypothetical protein